MKIEVLISGYRTRKCGTSIDCPNLQLTSKGWVAKYGSVVSVETQADERYKDWPHATVTFKMSAAEEQAAKKALGPWWHVDTILF